MKSWISSSVSIVEYIGARIVVNIIDTVINSFTVCNILYILV
jgi:hypothetical protein